MTFTLTVLGSGSSIPAPDKQSSAHVLNVHGRLYLIDCAEATQIALKKYGFSVHKIQNIFISHLHGDHYFGLPGLLQTMHLLNRQTPLRIYAHSALKEIIKNIFLVSETQLSYELQFVELDTIQSKTLIHTDRSVLVYAFPLKHKIPACGFQFIEHKRTRKLNKEFLQKHKMNVEQIRQVLSGADYIDEYGFIHKNEEITYQNSPARSYAYCSDTIYDSGLVDYIKGSTLLYHEASFLDCDLELAAQKSHSTARQAALIARAADVKQLIIGHLSRRYEDYTAFLEEARAVFANTVLAYDGLRIQLE